MRELIGDLLYYIIYINPITDFLTYTKAHKVMRIIALEGQSNSGKTQTLNLVYALLLNAGYTQLLNAFLDLMNDDCLDVLQGFGKTIGIVTQGDYAIGQYAVKNHLMRLKSFDCDIVICACTIGRNKQKIRDAIMAYPDYRFITKSKSKSADLVRIDNFNCAIHIMSMIENHLIL